VALSESEKFLLLYLHEACGNMGIAVIVLKFGSWNYSSVFEPHVPPVIPPNIGMSFEIMSGEDHLIGFINVGDFQLLLHCTEPIICLEWVGGKW
jgi:hypothetical protein